PYSISIGSVQSQNSVSQTSNVTVPVTVTKATSGEATPANLSRAFEWAYPTQTEYGFAVGNCTSAVNGTACQVSGTQNVTLIPPSGGWPSGSHFIYLEFVSPNGANKVQADNSAWFNAVQAYEGYFSNQDEGGTWKYYFGFGENISIKLFVYNSNYIPQEVNITKVEMSEDGDSCWSEYCKIYANYSYKVNGTGGTGINGNGTFRIINSGTWKRGQHSIKATIQGSAGSAVIKTGYVHVRDISLPNITVVSPQNGELINTTSFLSNVTANEDVTCSAVMWNYDAFSQSYCGAGNITSGACNNTRFNGSTYYSEIILTSYTPQKVHAHNIGVTGLTNQDYSIRTQCNDVDWNRAETYVTFTLNISLATAPVRVNLSSPANTTTVNSSTTTFKYNVTGPSSSTANCSVYVNVSNIWRVNVSNNVSLANVTNISTVNVAGFNNGTYVWNTYCSQTTNATNNAWAAANWTFTVANNVTTVISLVNVTLSSPANGATVNTSPVNFTYNLRGAGSANCSLYTNTTSSWLLNQTSNNIGNGSRSFSSSNIANGNYIWNVNCINSTNSAYEDWGDSNFTFNFINNVTLVPVTANLSSP
ncbi:MAG: hypothetical protein AABX69_03720, partial [Nanoarchaeota archaeon]